MMIDMNQFKSRKLRKILAGVHRSTRDMDEVFHAILVTQDVIERSREHFWVVGFRKLDQDRFLTEYIECVATGGPKAVLTSVSQIFCRAIERGADAIVCGHNHQSSNYSHDDARGALEILRAGEILGIELKDFIIISQSDGSLSFESLGFLKKYREDVHRELGRFREKENTMAGEMIFREPGQIRNMLNGLRCSYLDTEAPFAILQERRYNIDIATQSLLTLLRELDEKRSAQTARC